MRERGEKRGRGRRLERPREGLGERRAKRKVGAVKIPPGMERDN